MDPAVQSREDRRPRDSGGEVNRALRGGRSRVSGEAYYRALRAVATNSRRRETRQGRSSRRANPRGTARQMKSGPGPGDRPVWVESNDCGVSVIPAPEARGLRVEG